MELSNCWSSCQQLLLKQALNSALYWVILAASRANRRFRGTLQFRAAVWIGTLVHRDKANVWELKNTEEVRYPTSAGPSAAVHSANYLIKLMVPSLCIVHTARPRFFKEPMQSLSSTPDVCVVNEEPYENWGKFPKITLERELLIKLTIVSLPWEMPCDVGSASVGAKRGLHPKHSGLPAAGASDGTYRTDWEGKKCHGAGSASSYRRTGQSVAQGQAACYLI